MKQIAVLTSGGDAPGMNAAIRAVTRSALDRGWDVVGVKDGFAGLIARRFRRLGDRDVGGVLHVGGTMLGSSRHAEMKAAAGRAKALAGLEAAEADALVVIGGSGSQQGAHALAALGARVVGVASTIDNDLHGAEITIGVDTALNVALEAIDRLRVTA